MSLETLRPVEWLGTSYEDFVAFPDSVQDDMGYALYLAQAGRTPASVKPLKGFGGAGVLEIGENHRSGAYRAIYTVKFESAVYVLHAFQKKSRKGIETPAAEIELVRRRLKMAEEDHANRSRTHHEH